MSGADYSVGHEEFLSQTKNVEEEKLGNLSIAHMMVWHEE